MDGKGVYTWSNGDKFSGTFKNGQRNGKGFMTSAAGESFEGLWVNNKLKRDRDL
jgi:hypothetical protein